MAAANQLESLRLKYARKSLGASARGQENFDSAHESVVRDSNEEPTVKPEAQECKNYYSMETKTSSDNSPKLLRKLEETMVKLDEANKENSQNRMKISSLQQQLMAQELALKENHRQMRDLVEALSEKDKVIKQMKTYNNNEEKSSLEGEELQRLKETFVGHNCSLGQFSKALLRMKDDVQRLSAELQEERAQVAAKTEEVISLNKELDDERKVEKELERSLSAEANKNEILQEELKHLVEEVNREKQELMNGFDEFRRATLEYLKKTREHRTVLQQTVQESKSVM